MTTREEALKAWGKVWAGNSAVEISRMFDQGDFTGAKALADQLVARQEAGTSDVHHEQALEIDQALSTLRRMAPHMLAEAMRGEA